MAGVSNPATTYTLSDFIKAGRGDQLTYSHFTISEEINNISIPSHNIISDYMDELKKLCIQIPKENITAEQYARYKYNPDLLSYDIYGTVQLDFIVLYCNNIIDPKEFDLHNKYLYLPRASVLQDFLSNVYSADYNVLKEVFS